jgi:hypothetical protein
MTSRMPSQLGEPRLVEEITSPELVLVDPSLAEQSRAALPPSRDTFARIDELARARVLTARQSPGRVVSSPSPEPAGVPAGGGSRVRWALFAGGVAAVTAISLLVGVRVDVSGQTAGADSTVRAGPSKAAVSRPAQKAPKKATPKKATPKKATPKKAVRPPARRHAAGGVQNPARLRAATPAPTQRRFAWAPSQGASGYDVEFFRDGKRVYSGHTAGTTIEIPAHWTYQGATHEFHAGDYRWYVWPKISGRRSSTASVQTTISIAHG